MSLNPFTPNRFTDSTLFLKEVDGQKLLIKMFINEHKESRRELEFRKNLHWRASGFRVPRIIDIEFNEIVEPYIVMEYIDGVNLRDYLKNPGIPLATKLGTLDELFEISYKRHRLALEHEDVLLIHTDPNTDNIIISSDGLVFIDFEHFSRPLDMSTAVAREVATFARRAVKDLGVSYTQNVVEILLAAYNDDTSIFNSVEELTFGRPFQLLHRFKNKWKKLRDAKLVTRYDIAESIRLLRANAVHN